MFQEGKSMYKSAEAMRRGEGGREHWERKGSRDVCTQERGKLFRDLVRAQYWAGAELTGRQGDRYKAD